MARKAKPIDWQDLNRQIFCKLDMLAEFAALGIDVSGGQKASGWVECHAIGREDNSPSAAVNIETGRYRDLGGDGLSLSFYDLAVHIKRFGRWTDARDYYAAKAGIPIGSNGESPRDPAKHLAFLPWAAGLVSLWTRHKPGVTADAVQAAGGRIARYRDQYTVIALPILGPGFADADPVGWVLYNITGKELPIFHGKDKKITWAKMKTTGGSEGGLIGQHAIDRLTAADADPGAQLIWKVEGPSDLLALWSAIPPEQRDRHLVLTNSDGATAPPKPWMQSLFAGRRVAVVGDADTPGQKGAAIWAAWSAKSASESRIIRPEKMGFEVATDHGKDLRDYLATNTYQNLLEIADAAEVVTDAILEQSAPIGGQGDGITAIEADDDPHRLARVNLEQYATRTDGRTLITWRGEWYTWKKNAYRKIDEAELRAKLTNSIKREFDRINIEKQTMAESTGRDSGDPVITQKVSKTLVTNVLGATAGMSYISGSIEPNTWLPEKQRKSYVSMENGILDIDALLNDKDECLFPNTPQWFSLISLPYKFDPDATCPKWEAFLEHNLEMDPERIKILQEWVGYLLLPTTDEQKFMILEGEGKNGKSVFIAGTRAIVGEDNVSSVPLENFGDRFQLTCTIGKLLNAAGDCGDLDKAAEGILKSFTSGDQMHFDRKGMPGINCTPTARLMVACNNRPRFSDRTEGVFRRMLVIPWRVEIAKEKCVKGMDKASWWHDSGELSGMFLWAIRGLDRLRKQKDFTKSKIMEDALREYQLETNPARAFLTESCGTEDGAILTCKELYKAYCDWCKDNGHSHPLSQIQFGKEVRRRFPSVRFEREGSGARLWYYSGLAINRSF